MKENQPNVLLRAARNRKNWKQKDVADKIGTIPLTVGRWERGEAYPTAYYRQSLCSLFGMSPEELGFIIENNEQMELAQSSFLDDDNVQKTPLQFIWSVPYRRNPYFTGREDILEKLHRMLIAGKTTALTQPQALHGLGGIGKTQTAIEYCYRYHDSYRVILWVRADSHERLLTDFVTIANLLQLSATITQDEHIIISAVKRWLETHKDWLLILDNADDLTIVDGFLPTTERGHIILTTRASVMGSIAQSIELKKMSPDEGALLLLRRAKVVGLDSPFDQVYNDVYVDAEELSKAMDGLPLALDQAGAYIEEVKRNVSDYLKLFQEKGIALLKQRDKLALDYPKSVTSTWSLSFEKIEQANPAAAELLRFCAFLDPDTIPQEIIIERPSELGPILQPIVSDSVEFDAAIRELGNYSLINRDPDAKALNMHRLVQAVIQNEMDEAMQRLWAERAVQAVSNVFRDPDKVGLTLCQRYLSNALVCVNLIETRKLKCIEGAELLNNVGFYLCQLGNPQQAEPLHKQALAIREEALGSEHPDTAMNLSFLAACYNAQTLFKEAKTLAHRALTIQQRVLSPEHHDLAFTFNTLAYSYHNLDEYELAEQLFQRALVINEAYLGPDDLEVALNLNNLAALYNDEALYLNDIDKYKQAEEYYQRALKIRQRILNSDHPHISSTLNNLGTLYNDIGQYEQAEQYLLQALAIDEKVFGSDHPEVAIDLKNLAKVHRGQKKYDLAERYSLKALAIEEKAGRADHLDTAYTLTGLGEIYRLQQRYEKAEAALQRAKRIRQQSLGIEHLLTVKIFSALEELARERMQHENDLSKEDI